MNKKEICRAVENRKEELNDNVKQEITLSANIKTPKEYGNNTVATIDMNLTKKEIERIEEQRKTLPTFELKRRNKDFIDKTTSPLWKLEDAFIAEQEARRNSEYTIRHYIRTFKKLYEFFAFTTIKDTDDFDKLYDEDNLPESERNSPLAFYGKLLPIAVLEMDDLQKEFGNYLTDVEEVNEQTVLSYFRDFKAIMYFAMDNKWIESYRITVKAKEPDIKQVYTDTEIKKLSVKPKIDNFTEYRNWVIVKYLLATGNRVQTLINLKVEDIDLDEGYVNINTQKNKTTIRIPLVNKILRILEEYIDEYRSDEDGIPLNEEYLFCNRFGEKLSAGGLQSAIAEYNRSRGVQKTSIHLFRHTFAKNWITSGGDIASLQKMLGQNSLAVVQRYANLYSSDVKEKAEKHSTLAKQKTTSGKVLQRRNKKSS